MMTTATADLDQMLSCQNDVQDYIWSDTPGELGQVWGKAKTEKMGLRMKCSGWSVKLQEIWRHLDFSLEKMIDSLQVSKGNIYSVIEIRICSWHLI